MNRSLYLIKIVSFVMLCIITTSCHTLWIDKTGTLTALVSDVKTSELHDVYTLMRTSGYQMKKPHSTDLSEQENWEELDWGRDGVFVDPSYRSLVISYMYNYKDKRLRVSCNEVSFNKYGFVHRGFTAEGQSRADQVMASIKQRFGDSVKVVMRSQYNGIH